MNRLRLVHDPDGTDTLECTACGSSVITYPVRIPTHPDTAITGPLAADLRRIVNNHTCPTQPQEGTTTATGGSP